MKFKLYCIINIINYFIVIIIIINFNCVLIKGNVNLLFNFLIYVLLIN